MNSRAKGAAGEREWRDQLREQGFTARRGQQFSGGPDSPDVICEELAGLHMEVKRVQNLNLDKACEQAERDSRGKPWIVAHRKNNKKWKVTMPSDLFFKLLRDGMEGIMPSSGTLTTNHENTMQTENNTSKPKDSPKQDAGEVRDQGSAPSTNSAEERKLPNE